MATTIPIPTKSKSGLSDSSNSNHKLTPATPRVSKFGRAGSLKSDPDSPSPQNPRLSIDRSSPKSVDLKTSINRRSPNVSTPPEVVDLKSSINRRSSNVSTPPEKQSRALKGLELQAQLTTVQEDLKKAKERLASSEKEKARVLEELKDAKKLAEEVNGKLKEALLAQKKAEEGSEIEKFRADEIEQAGIEAAQKKEEEWKKEIENIREQHVLDVNSLISTTQELQRVKQELAMTCDAKNTALSHADDAMKIAEINTEKVELLSAEVGRLKSLLDSQMESKSNESQELVKQLDSEITALKVELEKAKAVEEKLVEMEGLVVRFKAEVDEAKRAESDANDLVSEWTKNSELLQAQLVETNESENSLKEALVSINKELEESNASLQDAESEIASLKGKVEVLELEVVRQKQELEESNQSLDIAKQETLEMETAAGALKSELQKVEDEKTEALNNEKIMVANLGTLSMENNRLSMELEIMRDEGEKVKKAMEGLTSALHEVSAEARETKEKFLAREAEVENAHTQIEELESTLKSGKESYEVMLDEAKYEIVRLRRVVETSEIEAENSRAEWEAKESNFMSAIKRAEEEVASTKLVRDELVESLKKAENEAQITKEDSVQLLDKLRQAEIEASLAIESMEEVKAGSLKLKERLLEVENEVESINEATKEEKVQLLDKVNKAESETTAANKAIEELKVESSLLKERLLDKENELQSITQENDELRAREASALGKIKELTSLLEEVTPKRSEEKVELLNGENEVVEKAKSEAPSMMVEEYFNEEPKPRENGNGYVEEEEKRVEGEKEVPSDREHEQEAESVADGEVDSKSDCTSLDVMNSLSSEKLENGATSPIKEQQSLKKKKKPLLHKFGSLLKKKGSSK